MTTLLEWAPDRTGARLRLRFWIDVSATGEWTICDAEGSKRLAHGRSRRGLEGAKRAAMKAAERLAATAAEGAQAPKGEQR